MKSCERHIPCFLLAAGLYCGCWTPNFAQAFAEETLEPRPINTTATPPKNEADDALPLKPAVRARKVYPPLPADPVYEIELKWRDAEAHFGGALTVLSSATRRGETPAPRLLDWRFPNEEAGPAPRTAAPLPGPGGADPEIARIDADSDDGERPLVSPVVSPVVSPAPVRPVARPAAKTPPQTAATQAKPALAVSIDPEAGRFIEVVELPEKPVARKNSRPAAARPVVPAIPDESPRIESGGGLDKDDPKPAVALAPLSLIAPEKQRTDKDIGAPSAAIDAAQDAGTLANADNSKTPARKWQAKDMLPESAKKAPGKTAAANAKGVDPEERTQQLLKEILEKQKNLEELTRKATDRLKTVKNPQNGMQIRDDHARKIVDTLTDAQRRLGAVSVKVYDPKTKQPLCARVSLIDTTEATARAPLPSGFFCRGVTPGITVVSGLVRAEINCGGRFFPTFIKGLDVLPGQILPLDVPMSRPPELNFEARGWILADLDIGLRKQAGEDSVWFGPPPTVNDLLLSAKTEGVRVIGVALPLGDETALNQVRAALANPNPDVLLIPVFPGPRNLFNGSGQGLGITSWEGLKPDCALPEVPLREGFDAIRSRGGLAVFKDLKGLRAASIDDEILPLYRRLKESAYFNGIAGSRAHLFSGSEFAFDTVTGAYDVLAFDGSDASEAVWFNLLNEGAPVRAIGAGGGSLEGGRIPFGQTFLQIDGAPTREKVLQAVEAGKTGISFGPAVFCKIFERDMGPGAVLPTDGRPLQLQIQAYSTLTPGAQLEKIEIVRNGKVVYTQTVAEGESVIQDMRFPLSETANAWYVVRATERLGHGIGHGRTTGAEPIRRAWTSPIFFRGAMFTPPAQCVTHVHGTLRKGLTPTRGVVTALATGMPTQRVESGPDGSFSIALPSTGTLIFEAADCEPSAKRIFEHPRVQNAVGKLMASDDLARKLADRPLFGLWRLLLSDLDWDVTLLPCAAPPEPPRLPEP